MQGQEYCLSCGARLVAPRTTGGRTGSRWWLRVLVAGVVALAGAAVAIAATEEDGTRVELTTAVGGFVDAPQTETLDTPSDGVPTSAAEWPSGSDGWTVVLASYPQTGGRKVATARAKKARAQGLPQVGVLDSSRYASLRPGYWVVFSGIYATEAEATSTLERARKASRAAAVRHVVA